MRSRSETTFVILVSQASAAITGCVQDASYACKKRTPHSRHFRFDSPPNAKPRRSTVREKPPRPWGVGRDHRTRRLRNENPMRNILKLNRQCCFKHVVSHICFWKQPEQAVGAGRRPYRGAHTCSHRFAARYARVIPVIALGTRVRSASSRPYGLRTPYRAVTT